MSAWTLQNLNIWSIFVWYVIMFWFMKYALVLLYSNTTGEYKKLVIRHNSATIGPPWPNTRSVQQISSTYLVYVVGWFKWHKRWLRSLYLRTIGKVSICCACIYYLGWPLERPCRMTILGDHLRSVKCATSLVPCCSVWTDQAWCRIVDGHRK